MENKINIAELLKDCPRDMELDCTVYDNIIFDSVVNWVYPIRVKTKDGSKSLNLTKYGCISENENAKCVIFPKGKTTWEGFVPPCKFKDGDIIYNQCIKAVAIFCKQTDNATISHCFLNVCKDLKIHYYHSKILSDWRLAAEEEKEKLFKAIKDYGYRWNPDTKTLEKLIEPVFKAGDRISLKCEDVYWDIKTIEGDWYICTNGAKIHIGEQHHYELVPVVSSTKFDITILKSFESKVLVRSSKESIWKPAIFGYYLESACYPYYVLGGTCWNQCIPYEENEHLLGTTNDCVDYYKIK